MTPQECSRRYETIKSRRARLANEPNARRASALRRANRKHVQAMAEFFGVGEKCQCRHATLAVALSATSRYLWWIYA